MNYFHFMKDGERRQECVRYNHGLAESSGSLPISVTLGGVSRWVGDIEVERHASGATNYAQTRVAGAIVEDSRSPILKGSQHSAIIEQVTAGNAFFVQNGKEYLVNPGEAFLIHKYGKHRYRTGPAGVLHKRYVDLKGPALEPLLRSLDLIDRDVIRLADPRAITTLLRRAYSLLGRKGADQSVDLSIAAYELLVLLRKNLPARFPYPLTRALSFIETNINRALSLGELCEYVDLSPTHLCRLFKAHFGMPPLKYFTSQRMIWAQHILSDFSLSIKEAAALVGYDDQLDFSAQFKKHFGLSPRAFRERSLRGH